MGNCNSKSDLQNLIFIFSVFCTEDWDSLKKRKNRTACFSFLLHKLMILQGFILCLSLIAVASTEEGIQKALQAELSQNSHWYSFNRCSYFSSSCFLYRAILPHQLFLLLTFSRPHKNKCHPCWALDTSHFSDTAKGLKKSSQQEK